MLRGVTIERENAGDLWNRHAGGALELLAGGTSDTIMVLRLHVTGSRRRPPSGSIEIGCRGANVLPAQSMSGYAELLWTAC